MDSFSTVLSVFTSSEHEETTSSIPTDATNSYGTNYCVLRSSRSQHCMSPAHIQHPHYRHYYHQHHTASRYSETPWIPWKTFSIFSAHIPYSFNVHRYIFDFQPSVVVLVGNIYQVSGRETRGAKWNLYIWLCEVRVFKDLDFRSVSAIANCTRGLNHRILGRVR
ncbi:hypothetical protein OG21DRAFT_1140865 [Imleria badia]|nr:hypothetical protein OG21DRAFT_1140865 [Imleria badia]